MAIEKIDLVWIINICLHSFVKNRLNCGNDTFAAFWS